MTNSFTYRALNGIHYYHYHPLATTDDGWRPFELIFVQFVAVSLFIIYICTEAFIYDIII